MQATFFELSIKALFSQEERSSGSKNTEQTYQAIHRKRLPCANGKTDCNVRNGAIGHCAGSHLTQKLYPPHERPIARHGFRWRSISGSPIPFDTARIGECRCIREVDSRAHVHADVEASDIQELSAKGDRSRAVIEDLAIGTSQSQTAFHSCCWRQLARRYSRRRWHLLLLRRQRFQF